MQWFNYFITQNFILLCIIVVVIINLIQHFDVNKRVSIYSIIIMGMAFLLSISTTSEYYFKTVNSFPFTTFFSFMGYVLRPVILYLFILMSIKEIKHKAFYLTIIPLIINLCVYLLCFIPGPNELVVYFHEGKNGAIAFAGGPLRFTSHIISLGYMIWWFVISISQFRIKHFNQGLTIVICALFVLLSVIIESFFNENGEIFILNSVIGLSVLVYYLYIYTESTQLDLLTNFYNRHTFYRDLPKMRKSINAVVQFDINGLKYINDNFGHKQGDLAISTIANIINKNSNHKMYNYRLGGDEFIVFIINGTNEEINEFIENINNDIKQTKYSCSIGCSIKEDDETSIDLLLKTSEQKMYVSKANYYKTSNIERRK